MNPWKITAIGLALVLVTALVTGLVVANWTAPATDGTATEKSAAGPPVPPADKPAASAVTATPASPAHAAEPVTATRHRMVPTQASIATCNEYAAAHVGRVDKTTETLRDAAIGVVVGAAVGAASGGIAGGGRAAGKGAAIGGLVGAGGGTLYGLNQAKQRDERYRIAYASCMRSRGYAG